MMKTRQALVLILVSGLLVVSCAPRLVGTWTVARYENIMPGSEAVMLSNIGTMTFRKNHEGSQDLRYQLFGTPRQIISDFDWHQGERYVSIKGSDSDFAKTWIVVEDKKKKQVWKSTDNSGRIQTLELSR